MDSRRRLSIISLLILTGLFVAGGAFLAVQLQQSQAPDDTGATGFGDNADLTLIPIVKNNIANTSCETFLETGFLSTVDYLADKTFILQDKTDLTTSPYAPKDCFYTSGDLLIHTAVFSYPESYDFIPDSFQNLVNDVNGLLLDQVYKKGRFNYTDTFNITYFYGDQRAGEDDNGKALTSDTCTVTMYHNWNDINYAAVDITGFGDCFDGSLAAAAVTITEEFAENLNEAIVNVYVDNGITGEVAKFYIENYNIPIL